MRTFAKTEPMAAPKVAAGKHRMYSLPRTNFHHRTATRQAHITRNQRKAVSALERPHTVRLTAAAFAVKEHRRQTTAVSSHPEFPHLKMNPNAPNKRTQEKLQRITITANTIVRIRYAHSLPLISTADKTPRFSPRAKHFGINRWASRSMDRSVSDQIPAGTLRYNLS